MNKAYHNRIRPPLAPPILQFLLICLKIKALQCPIYPKGHTWGVCILKPIQINAVQIPSKGNRWYMVASLPEELRKFYNNQRHTRKSCGSFSKVSTYAQATALINSEKGRAFKESILSHYNKIDPLIFSAQELLKALFATYDEQERIYPESKWHDHKISKDDCMILGNPKENQEEYDRLVNRLRAMMTIFLDAEIIFPGVDIDSGFKADKLFVVGGGVKNKIWVDSISNISGFDQEVKSKTIGVSYGNSFLAALSLAHTQRDYINIGNPIKRSIISKPDKIYSKQFKLFKNLYENTSNLL